jgi:hypothetical protein
LLSKHKAAARAAYAESIRAGTPPEGKALWPRPTGAVAKCLGWESSVPRCETCKHREAGKTILNKHTTRLPVLILPPVCRRGRFATLDTALCNFWTGKDGSTLEN